MGMRILVKGLGEALMNWKDLRFSRKMMIGIGSILVMLVIVAVWSIVGISSVVKGRLEVSGGNKLRSELLQREVDHLKWAQEVGTVRIRRQGRRP